MPTKNGDEHVRPKQGVFITALFELPVKTGTLALSERQSFWPICLLSSRDDLIFFFQFGGIGAACWWHNAVLAQINNHLAVVVCHVPDAHHAQA